MGVVGVRYETIHAAVVEALGTLKLRESRFDYSRFGSEPQSHVHRTFAIGMDADEDRTPQRRDTPRSVAGELVVRLAHRQRADKVVWDRLAAHTLAEDAVNAVLLQVDRSAGFHLQAVGRTRSVVGDGTYLITDLVFAVDFLAYRPTED